ncbi:unnamed protein product [Periconia digitata]|uniref:Uncharacterized protein n=1 Tax=Periconia digitata TaxID=1303443 RepID=A0A9W4XUB3_9PLEO|nr:unnamed protein product [Periconia digitata]
MHLSPLVPIFSLYAAASLSSAASAPENQQACITTLHFPAPFKGVNAKTEIHEPICVTEPIVK